MKKKVLIINSGDLPLPPTSGGAVEKLVDDFCSYRNSNQKFEITVYSKYDKNASKIKTNYIIKYIRMSKRLHIIYKAFYHIINNISGRFISNEFIHKVKKNIVKEKVKYDILIIENSPQYINVIPKEFYNIAILHLHNDYINIDMRYSKDIIKKYDYIYCVSKFIEQRILKVSANYKGTRILYNGVDLRESVNNINIRKKYCINANNKIIVYSGRIVPEKGICDVIDIFNSKKFKNLTLLIIGKYNFSTKYSDNIVFTGYIRHEDLMGIYKQCDYGIVPSKCNEAFGVSAIEFLKMQLPIIYTNDGALPEIVNEKCGILVDKNNFYDEMVSILSKIDNDTIDKKKFDKSLIDSYSTKYSTKIYCETFIKHLEEIDYEKK